MKKFSILLFLILGTCISQVSFAQKTEPRERIESAKIAFMTDRLNLTPEQSTQFWPIYNEYSEKKGKIRSTIRQLRANNATQNTPEAQLKENIDKMLRLKQKEVDMEKEYVDRFLKVISPRQLVDMYRSEHEFNKMLLERLEDRRTENRQHP